MFFSKHLKTIFQKIVFFRKRLQQEPSNFAATVASRKGCSGLKHRLQRQRTPHSKATHQDALARETFHLGLCADAFGQSDVPNLRVVKQHDLFWRCWRSYRYW